MKKIFTAAAAALVIASCTSDLSSLNVNSKAPEQVPAGALIANSTVTLTDYLTSVNVNLNNFILWSQHWTQTTYTDESNFNYNNRDVNGNTFDAMYATVLRDLNDASKFIEADDKMLEEHKRNQLALIEVMEVYTYHVLVDIFGDVPYSEAIGDDVTPKYDNDAEIYSSLVTRLLAAHGNLGGDNGLGNYDLLYGGDANAWKKFAASLALKLAVRAADVNPSASSVAEAAAAAGVFTSSADGAILGYTSSPPNTNPLWDDLVQSGRADFCAANTFADILNGLSDPRRGTFFRNLDANGDVIGAPYGLASSYALNSQPGDALEDPSKAASLMDYAEVEFLLADAAARGWNVGSSSAADHYAAAVTASIEDWGGSASDAATYLAQTDVAWDATMWKQRIGVQKWIAMYTRGNEAWATQRLYDYPAMNVAVEALIVTPYRMSYGIDEYSLNGTNGAAARGGNDDQMSKVFWDAN
jgi:hypothetical protein